MQRKKQLKLDLKELFKDRLHKFPKLVDATSDDLKEIFYRNADLTWKLNTAQREVYDFFHNCKEDIVVCAISRQSGKSFTAITLGFEACLKYKNYIVRYASGDATGALKIIRSNVLDMMGECPEDLRPTYDQKINAWKFPNGSLLYLAGVDGSKADKSRGGTADLIIVDEAAFISNLTYVIDSVFMPMTNTTNGKFLIISTPPKSRGHEFVEYVENAKRTNAYYELNIYDYLDKIKDDHEFFSSLISREKIEKVRRKILPSVFSKEYLLKYETDTDHAVIPEFTEELKANIIKRAVRPKDFQPYVAMDIGVKDLTALVFGYYDPYEDKIVVEDELQVDFKKENSDHLAKSLLRIEKDLWGNAHGEILVPVKRFCDINEKIFVQDLKRKYQINFKPIAKDNKDDQIQHLRTSLYNEIILIDPKCKNTIAHLENAVWNKSKNDYERSQVYGHYDFVDAMVYFARAIKRKKIEGTPEPANPNNRFTITPKTTTTQTTKALQKIFRPKIRRFGQ